MKNVKLLGLVLIFALFACSGAGDKEDAHLVYGENPDYENVQTPTALRAALEQSDSIAANFEGKVLEVCKKKGCWMKVDYGAEAPLMVTFKDYGFFVPEEIEGEEVILEGTVKKELIDIATLQHYAEDAGKSQEEIDAIDQPEEKYTMVATGVRVKDVSL